VERPAPAVYVSVKEEMKQRAVVLASDLAKTPDTIWEQVKHKMDDKSGQNCEYIMSLVGCTRSQMGIGDRLKKVEEDPNLHNFTTSEKFLRCPLEFSLRGF
jgi:hypothetical protein